MKDKCLEELWDIDIDILCDRKTFYRIDITEQDMGWGWVNVKTKAS